MKTNNNESEKKKYMITLSTDPYHGRLVCERRGRVLERCGATPVKVVIEDDFGRGLTLKDAKKELRDIVANSDRFWHEDAESVHELMAEIAKDLRSRLDEGEEMPDVSEFPDWYEGEGWYTEGHCLVYKEGDTHFEDDIRRYSIEEFIPEEEEE
ncbi:MAG: hypothetical protein LUI09_03270 [Prevotellaceae bacterium]|nr:hypothetical protein [Prevotellaceae bacterium]